MYSNRPEYNTPEYRSWRFNCFKSFNYTCAMCHEKGKQLEAHHIIKYAVAPELVFSPSNAICLCKDCHRNKVTGHEESYEARFKEIVAQKKIQAVSKREARTGKKKKKKPPYRPRNPYTRW